MQHATLYKRTKTGAIQYWSICVNSTMGGEATILKESGQLGTANPTFHKEEITTGKNIGRSNETTPLQQAEMQALADWTKKHDEGYKSLEDLGSSDTEEDWLVDGTMQGAFEKMYRWVDEALPQFNTDANGNVKPMLAKPVDWAKVTYPCLVQPKLDGVRCLMIVGDKSIKFLSRNGKEYTTLLHIAADVLLSGIAIDQSFILDGEIYSDEITFQEIIAAVKKQRPDSLKLKFRAYDVVNDEVQEDRWATTVKIVDAIGSPLVWPVSTLTLMNQAQVKEHHDKWVSEGNEGAMIRLRDGKYGQGQRSSHLLKVKEFDSNEFPFVRFEVGQREEDLIAVCTAANGTCFKAKVIGTRAEKLKLQAIPSKLLEYKQYTVKHFGLTNDGLPRFPIGVGFRDYE